MSLHNDNALVVALDTSTDMLACAASWIDRQTGETKLVSGRPHVSPSRQR